MKQLLLILVMLFSSITYAQLCDGPCPTVFSFACGPTAAEIAEELKALTASRTLELEALSSETTSVNVSWDSGHVITIDGNDILADDYGHQNYGYHSDTEFDSLLDDVRDAVTRADYPYTELGMRRTEMLAKVASAAVSATTANVLVSVSTGMNDENHSQPGFVFDKVIFSDNTGANIISFDLKFSNGGKKLEEGTDTEINNWIGQFDFYVSQYQPIIDSEVRSYFVAELETAFAIYATATISIEITQNQQGNDVILYSNSDGSLYTTYHLNGLIENLEQYQIDRAIELMAQTVSDLQDRIDAN